MRAPLAALCLLPTALALQGCPSCPYEEACDGNTLKYCYLGVDQLVGSPEEGERPCEGPNPVCVTIDDRNAACIIDEARTCTSTSAYCEGDLRVGCTGGFERAEDCAADGAACFAPEGAAGCFEAPLTACDPSWPARCDGTVRRFCLNRYVSRVDCARDEGYTCREGENEYGAYAYCALEDSGA